MDLIKVSIGDKLVLQSHGVLFLEWFLYWVVICGSPLCLSEQLCKGLPHHNCTAARLSIIVSAFIAHLLYYLQAHCANKDLIKINALLEQNFPIHQLALESIQGCVLQLELFSIDFSLPTSTFLIYIIITNPLSIFMRNLLYVMIIDILNKFFHCRW